MQAGLYYRPIRLKIDLPNNHITNPYICGVTYTTNNNQIHIKHVSDAWNPIYINLMVLSYFPNTSISLIQILLRPTETFYNCQLLTDHKLYTYAIPYSKNYTWRIPYILYSYLVLKHCTDSLTMIC